jgi:vanillate O-demethylase ferredoxin subunit
VLTISTRLLQIDDLSADVRALTLGVEGPGLVGLEAGAHLDVHLGTSLIRQYSVVDWATDGSWVSIAVKREAEGRGGSVAMHALAVGDRLDVSGPRNNFPLVSGAEPVVLLAGGIGVTPVYAMARALQQAGRPFEVHYFVRSKQHAAFDARLAALGLDGDYLLHCDDTEGFPDFFALLKSYPADVQLYVCGPEVMLNAVQKASTELGVGTVHFERFAALPFDHEGDERAFQVVVSSTGQTLDVPAETSILDVLRDAGHDVDWGCSEGVCGTCITDVLDGVPDHRDSILTEDEREAGDCLCICVSRAQSDRLVLDL